MAHEFEQEDVEESAIDHDVLPGDIARVLRREESDDVRDIGWSGEAGVMPGKVAS